MITVFTKPKRTKEKKGTTTLEYYFSEILNIIEKQHNTCNTQDIGYKFFFFLNKYFIYSKDSLNKLGYNNFVRNKESKQILS